MNTKCLLSKLSVDRADNDPGMIGLLIMQTDEMFSVQG